MILMMKNGEIPGFRPYDVAELAETFRVIYEEQRQMPWWFKGFPLDSAPARMMTALQNELGMPHDPNDPDQSLRMDKAHKRLNILGGFHRGYEELRKSYTPSTSITLQEHCTRLELEEHKPPFYGYGIENFGPYLDEVVDAYDSFYNPKGIN